jgi:hypothetical protein
MWCGCAAAAAAARGADDPDAITIAISRGLDSTVYERNIAGDPLMPRLVQVRTCCVGLAADDGDGDGDGDGGAPCRDSNTS